MCYPKPGPRCSNHARMELDKVQQAMKIAHQKRQYFNMKPLYEAEAVYDSTSEGQAKLAQQLERDDLEQWDRLPLEARVIEGIRRHHDEMRAYKRSVGEEVKPLPHEVPCNSWVDKRERKESYDNSVFENIMIRDENNQPQFYAKVHYYQAFPDGKGDTKPCLVICDIEKNPNLENNISTEQAMARLASQYEVDAVEFSGYFTGKGWNMFRRMRSNGAPVRLQSLGDPNPRAFSSVRLTKDEMNFVENWESETLTFHL